MIKIYMIKIKDVTHLTICEKETLQFMSEYDCEVFQIEGNPERIIAKLVPHPNEQ